MRLLFLTSRLPFPPDRGDRVRVFNFIKHLSREHEIVLVSFISSPHEREYAAELSQYCRAVHLVLHRPLKSLFAVALNVWRDLPLQALYYRSRTMKRKIDEVLATARIEAAYIHLFRMAPYSDQLRTAYRIVDLTDAISREVGLSLAYRGPLSRLLYTFERTRIERYERRVTHSCDEAWVIAERDRRALIPGCRESVLHVVPNGIHPHRFQPRAPDQENRELLFVGNMSVPHNVDSAKYLAHEILPLVQADVPGVRLTIAGADPVRAVRTLDRIPGVFVTGFVPELNTLFDRASVFVAPLRFGAGVQNKVIEAMAAGLPVVTTTIVSVGIGAEPERELLVGDDAESFAKHVVDLCGDVSRRQRLAEAGYDFVNRHFSWRNVCERMRTVERIALSLPR